MLEKSFPSAIQSYWNPSSAITLKKKACWHCMSLTIYIQCKRESLCLQEWLRSCLESWKCVIVSVFRLLERIISESGAYSCPEGNEIAAAYNMKNLIIMNWVILQNRDQQCVKMCNFNNNQLMELLIIYTSKFFKR